MRSDGQVSFLALVARTGKGEAPKMLDVWWKTHDKGMPEQEGCIQQVNIHHNSSEGADSITEVLVVTYYNLGEQDSPDR